MGIEYDMTRGADGRSSSEAREAFDGLLNDMQDKARIALLTEEAMSELLQASLSLYKWMAEQRETPTQESWEKLADIRDSLMSAQNRVKLAMSAVMVRVMRAEQARKGGADVGEAD